MTVEDEQRAARQELSAERWKAHKDVHESEKELGDQKWSGHIEQHASIARNLTEYKSQSNEWRGSLSDLRSTYTPISTHEAFEKEMRSALDALNRRIDTEREERRDQQNLRTGSVDTWKWIAGFLGVSGVGAVVWAIVNAPK